MNRTKDEDAPTFRLTAFIYLVHDGYYTRYEGLYNDLKEYDMNPYYEDICIEDNIPEMINTLYIDIINREEGFVAIDEEDVVLIDFIIGGLSIYEIELTHNGDIDD